MSETTRATTREPSAADQLDLVWAKFKEGERDARDSLIVNYSPLVKYVASRVAAGLPSNIDQADLVSDGMFGLIDALDKFDLERSIKFETYAIPRIRGAIIDALRSRDWVPRSVRVKQREFDKAYAEVEAREKRAPTDAEVAQSLGLSLGELHDTVTQIASLTVLALDEPVSGGDRGETMALVDTLTDHASGDLMAELEANETRALLSSAINALSDRAKVVVTLYYFEGMTLSEIGEVLGVTESRVCQIHTKSVAHLRASILDDDEH